MTATDNPDEREQFLTTLMCEALTAYESGHRDLARLVSDLESLISSLEDASDASWIGALRREWGELEIVHALALDEGRSALTSDEKRDVNQTVDELGLLLDRSGSMPGDHVDSSEQPRGN